MEEMQENQGKHLIGDDVLIAISHDTKDIIIKLIEELCQMKQKG